MNSIDWLDTNDIAIELSEKFPEIDPQWISFLIYIIKFVT